MNDKNIKENIVDTLMDNYMPYAMSVIVSRAIPQIDGFKPSHRKLLYTMYKMGLLKGNRTKSANVVGQTMKLNPHGDAAIYETMVKLAKSNENLLHAYVDSKGNFGKAHSRDMKYAAPRYTEVKLDAISEEIFKDIDKNTVDFVDNYDGTMEEPVLLPTTFPNILVKANKGIAVGMASSIPSFNLKEVCEYVMAYMKNKNADIEEYIKGPDLPSGGDLIYEKENLKEIYETGKGSFKLRGKYKYFKKESLIEIYEIPYTTTVEAIIEKIIELIKAGKIKEITDVRDETDLKGLKITLDIKKSADPDQLMAKLYRATSLEDSFGCNFNILIDNRPKVLGIREITENWLTFRRNSIVRKANYEIEAKSKKLKLLLGLKEILLDIDKAIKIIRETKKEKEVITNLMAGFNIDEEQAEYIADIKLRNLNEEYIINRIEEIKDLTSEIENLKKLSEDEKLQNKYISKELKHVITKYGQERKTTIITPEEITVEAHIDKIPEYRVNVFLTEHGYMKKITDSSLRGNSEHKTKDDDKIITEIQCNNTDILMAFTNKQNLYRIKLHEIPDTKASLLGEYLPNVLEMEEDEKILHLMLQSDYSGFMMYIFENGKMAKIPVASYQTKGFRRKMQNAYSDKSNLIKMIYTKEDGFIIIKSNEGKEVVIDTSMINPISTRSSVGVQIVKLPKNVLIENVEFDTGKIEKKVSFINEEGNEEIRIELEDNKTIRKISSEKIPAVFKTGKREPKQESFL